jgi:hypothetical protein
MWIMLAMGSLLALRDWAGQLGESGEYHMGRVRVVCFHIRSSEGGNLC